MISSIAWVPRGACKEFPDEAELGAEEMEALVNKSAGLSMNHNGNGAAAADDSDDDYDSDASGNESDAAMEEGDNAAEAKPAKASSKRDAAADAAIEEAFMAELNLEGYEEEEEGAELFLGGNKLTVFENNAEDPYITVADDADDDADEAEDLVIKPDDACLLVGRTEEEQSNLEMYIYEESTGSLYVHHDFPLPSFPLSQAWMNFDPRPTTAPSAVSSSTPTPTITNGSVGSFVAIGTFQPQIEIWNLDVLDVLEPVCILGGRNEAKKTQDLQPLSKGQKKKLKKKGASAALQNELLGEFKEGSHTDAVMSLSWHVGHRNLLCSGSADKTMKVWDLTTQSCVNTLTCHSNKVQSIELNPSEPSILLSGSYDRTARLNDIRVKYDAKANNSAAPVFNVDVDVEQVRWNPHHAALFAISCENGNVFFFDARKPGSNPLITLAAHNQATTSISFNPHIPSLIATAGLDKAVKLWDLNYNAAATSGPALTPTMLHSKGMSIGPIFSMGFDVSRPYLIAAGGGKDKLAIWDIREQKVVQQKYGSVFAKYGEYEADQSNYVPQKPREGAEAAGDSDAEADPAAAAESDDDAADMQEEMAASLSSSKDKKKKIKKNKKTNGSS